MSDEGQFYDQWSNEQWTKMKKDPDEGREGYEPRVCAECGGLEPNDACRICEGRTMVWERKSGVGGDSCSEEK